MASHGSASFQRHFQDLQDPRVERTRKHPLINIVFVSVCGVLSGANSFAGIHEFAIDRRNWLAGYLDLTHGIPSEDTFARVLARLDPGAFEKCLLSWVQAVQEVTDHRMVAIDGKTVRGSSDHETGRAAIHMVSAWATENKLSLGQVVVDEKSNEITAIPELLQVLEISGALVTIEVMGCQKEIADQIRERGPTSSWPSSRTSRRSMSRSRERSMRPWNRTPRTSMSTRPSRRDTAAGRPGRTPSFRPESVDPEDLWRDLSAVGIAISERVDSKGRHGMETRYYILSRLVTVREFATAVRGHWGIENNLHWQLDVSFREDECRVCRDHGPANLSVIRRFVLGLLKRDTSCRKGIEIKRNKCAANDEYRERVLFTC